MSYYIVYGVVFYILTMYIVCYVMVYEYRLAQSNYNGAGRRRFSCGGISGKYNFCLTTEIKTHLFTSAHTIQECH
jgi:hypothetical protein